MKKNIFVYFNGEKYKIIFTKHGAERIKQRGITEEILVDSIENYDLLYDSFGKKVVEKNRITSTIRTVFSIKKDNIILITSMRLGK